MAKTRKRGNNTNKKPDKPDCGPDISSDLLGFDANFTLKQYDDRTRMMLSRALNLGGVLAFVGSGVSRAFDYPDWKELANRFVSKTKGEVRKELAALLKERSGSGPESTPLSHAERLLLCLDRCKQILKPDDVETIMSEAFGHEPNDMPPEGENPILKIVDRLNIRRFLTTNYDDSIFRHLRERREEKEKEKEKEEESDSPRPTSDFRRLVIDESQSEQLRLFASRAPGFEQGVFHLHGHVGEPNKPGRNYVLTERDYQRVYLQGDPLRRVYREAIELAFSASPVIFLGIGMSEPDLLRPLRRFVSEQASGGRERLLFALLPTERRLDASETSPVARRDRELWRFLYLRYGVKTVFYEKGSAKEQRRNLCKAIDRIGNDWATWWTGWQRKPKVRTPAFKTFRVNDEQRSSDLYKEDENGKVMLYHATKWNKALSGSTDALWDAREVMRNLDARRVAVVVGRPGTGKGGLSHRIVMNDNEIPEMNRYRRIFVGTVHFSNDFNSILRSASDHLSGDGSLRKYSPLGAFEELMNRRDDSACGLIVIGGFDRLLSGKSERVLDVDTVAGPLLGHWQDEPLYDLPHGRSISAEIGRFLEILANSGSGKGIRVVLTSSLLPERLLHESRPKPKYESNKGIWYSNSLTVINFGKLLKHGGGERQRESFIQLLKNAKDLALVSKSTRNFLPNIDAEFLQGDAELSEAIGRLLYALRGHVYVLSLLAPAWLLEWAINGREHATQWLGRLDAHLSSLDIARRPLEAFRRATETIFSAIAGIGLRPPGRKGQPERWMLLNSRRKRIFRVLEHIALVSTPVNGRTLKALLWEKLPSTESKDSDIGIDTILEHLVQSRLITQLEYPKGAREDVRYTAHTLARMYVQAARGAASDTSGEPHRLELSGFTRPFDEDYTGAIPAHDDTCRAVDKLLTATETRLARLLQRGPIELASSRDRDSIREFIRATFGLIRGRWTATNIGRLYETAMEESQGQQISHYHSYQRRLSRLLNVMRKSSPGLWERETEERDEGRQDRGEKPKLSRDEQSKNESEYGSLYVDELGWLYNELATIAFCQGAMHDAWGFFRVGQDVIRFAEHPDRKYRWCHAEINLAMVEIDRAHLRRAIEHLDVALRRGREIKDEDVVARSYGYLGLAHHLGGNYEKSLQFYTAALKMFEERENRRGVSIFSRHLSDLYHRRKDLPRSSECLQDSIAAAEGGRHWDQWQYSRLARAKRMLDDRKGDAAESSAEALQITQTASAFARKVGIPKLEVEALKVQVDVALHQGEYDLADRLITRCLSVVTLHGMRLRKTGVLVKMGRVARYQGRQEMADQILDSAIKLAQRQQYQVQLDKAEEEMTQLKKVSR